MTRTRKGALSTSCCNIESSPSTVLVPFATSSHVTHASIVGVVTLPEMSVALTGSPVVPVVVYTVACTPVFGVDFVTSFTAPTSLGTGTMPAMCSVFVSVTL